MGHDPNRKDQTKMAARVTGGNVNDEESVEDEGNDGDKTTTSLEAELAAMREELAALRKVFEERYQAQ